MRGMIAITLCCLLNSTVAAMAAVNRNLRTQTEPRHLDDGRPDLGCLPNLHPQPCCEEHHGITRAHDERL